MLLLSATLLLLSLSSVGSGELGTCSLATSFDAWYKYNFDVFQPGNPFVIEDIPNPLCALMTNGQSTGCSECSSKLQQWYLSQKCMAACHEHNCAPYDDLVVECTFAPDNFLSGPPEELKWGAKCTCPANTIHAGEEMTVADTSYKQMLDEWNRNRCYDSKAVGSVGIVDCDPFACSSSNITWCATNAVCTTNHSNPHGFTCDYSVALTAKCALPTIGNGAVNDSAVGGYFSAGTSLTAICDPGYGIVGDDVIVCQDNGTWITATLICVKCTEVPTITNGEYVDKDGNVSTASEYPGGTALTASCNMPYGINGNPTITCGILGEWEPNPSSQECRRKGVKCTTVDDCADHDEAYCGRIFDSKYCFDFCKPTDKCANRDDCVQINPDFLWCDYCIGYSFKCSDGGDCCSGVCKADGTCKGTSFDDDCTVDFSCDPFYDSDDKIQKGGTCVDGHCVA